MSELQEESKIGQGQDVPEITSDATDNSIPKTTNPSHDGEVVSPVPSITSAKPLKPKESRKKLVITTLLLLVLLSAGAFWLFSLKNSTPTTQVFPQDQSSAELQLAMRHDSVEDYLKENDVEWLAIPAGLLSINGEAFALYSHANGLPGGQVTAIVRHNGQLWVSTQEGVVSLDEKSGQFKESKSQISNGKLHYDAYENRLFLSTFEGFFELRDDKWQAVEGQVVDAYSSLQFATGKDNIVVTSNRMESPVWVLDRSSNKWKNVQPKIIDDQVASTFELNDQVFIMGRSKGYENCGSAGQVTATSVERLDVNEEWQALTSFNSDVARPELNQIRVLTSDKIMAETSTCDGNTKTEQYTLTFDGRTLNLGDKITIEENGGLPGLSETEQKLLVERINSVTKTPPYMEVLGAESDGSLLVGYSNDLGMGTFPTITNLAVLKKGLLDQKVEIVLPKSAGSKIVPIRCGTDKSVKYIFIGEEESSEGGSTGNWDKTLIYPYTDGKLGQKAFDLAGDVSVPVFSCAESFIAWAGKTSVKKLDTNSGSITVAGPQFQTPSSSMSASATPTGNLWILFGDQNKESNNVLYHANINQGSLKKIGAYKGSVSLDGNDSFVWLSSGPRYASQSDDTETTRIDITGKESTTIAGSNVAWATIFGDNQTLILQPQGSPQQGAAPYQVMNVAKDGSISDVKTDGLPWRFTYSDARVSILDNSRSKTWINEAGYGTFAIDLPSN